MSDEHSYVTLPTGKCHVSYSEIKDWKMCSWRHKLKHIDKLSLDEPGVFLLFGTALHASCEDFLKTRVMKDDIAVEIITKGWIEHAKIDSFVKNNVDEFINNARFILAEVEEFMNSTFPNWECIDAEHALYEPIAEGKHAFKGFIDGIIACDGKRGRVYWLLDWKTASWGWSMQKKTDEMVKAQLIFYKKFWSDKMNVEPKDVKCGFVLLKRTAKTGQRCELVPVSVGDVSTGKTLKVLNGMIAGVKRNIAIKNRGSCEYCEYKGTPHCT
jgi:hypothetical protein